MIPAEVLNAITRTIDRLPIDGGRPVPPDGRRSWLPCEESASDDGLVPAAIGVGGASATPATREQIGIGS